MKTQLPVIQPNSLRVVLRVLFMLAVPLVGFALFAGNIHISNAASTYVIEMKDYQYQNRRTNSTPTATSMCLWALPSHGQIPTPRPTTLPFWMVLCSTCRPK